MVLMRNTRYTLFYYIPWFLCETRDILCFIIFHGSYAKHEIYFVLLYSMVLMRNTRYTLFYYIPWFLCETQISPILIYFVLLYSMVLRNTRYTLFYYIPWFLCETRDILCFIIFHGSYAKHEIYFVLLYSMVLQKIDLHKPAMLQDRFIGNGSSILCLA